MLVVTRYRVPAQDTEEFLADADRAAAVLSACPGCRGVQVGRAVDDGSLWLLESVWESVGAYRRALSGYEVRLHVVPLLSRCLDEPSAFEVRLEATDGTVSRSVGALSERQVRPEWD